MSPSQLENIILIQTEADIIRRIKTEREIIKGLEELDILMKKLSKEKVCVQQKREVALTQLNEILVYQVIEPTL